MDAKMVKILLFDSNFLYLRVSLSSQEDFCEGFLFLCDIEQSITIQGH